MPDHVNISSLGLICAVGQQAAPACAAMRAGIGRPSGLTYFPVYDPDNHGQQDLVAMQVKGYTEGFFVVGAWKRLALGCLEDLLRGLPDKTSTQFWNATAIIFVLCEVPNGRFDEEDETTAEEMHKIFSLPVVERSGLAFGVVKTVCEGRMGIVDAMAEAFQLFGEHAVERVAIISVDSFIDPLSLDWLDQEEKLKSSENPAGIIPGEAAAGILLESSEGNVLARIHLPACGEEPFEDGQLLQGRALAQSIKACIEGQDSSFQGLIVSDFNGESNRAQEFGAALHHLRDQLGNSRTFFPAEYTGETGAALPVTGICYAVHAIQRRVTQQSLVLASSGQGRCAAMLVSHEPT